MNSAGTSDPPHLVEEAVDPHIGGHRQRVGWSGPIGAPGRFDESGGGQVPDGHLAAGRVEWAELGHRVPVDGDDDPFAGRGPPDDRRHLVPQFPDPDPFEHRRTVARVYTARLVVVAGRA
jgi:hypothetical protein